MAIAAVVAADARADDLSRVSGNWAVSAEACGKWSGPGFETMAEQSGKIMHIKGDTISWSRGSCTVSKVLVRGKVITGRASCEYRMRAAAGNLKIRQETANSIVVENVLSGRIDKSLATTFVKCDCAPHSDSDYLGCHK